MKKSVLGFIVFMAALFITSSAVNAASLKSEDIDAIDSFITISGKEEITVQNQNGMELDNSVSKQVENYLLDKKYEEALELIEENDWKIQIIEEEEESSPFQTFSIGSTISRTYKTVYSRYDPKYLRKGTWVSELHVRYRENPNGTLTALSKPTIKVTIINQGIEPKITKLVTGYKYSNGNKRITFYGDYHLTGLGYIPAPLMAKEYNWGFVYETARIQ